MVMEKREFTVEEIRKVAAGIKGARYLLVSVELYKQALRVATIEGKVDLCPIALGGIRGGVKVWAVVADVLHNIEFAELEQIQSVMSLFDAETDEEKAARATVTTVIRTVKDPVRVGRTPSRRWFKKMSDTQTAAVEEMEAA